MAQQKYRARQRQEREAVLSILETIESRMEAQQDAMRHMRQAAEQNQQIITQLTSIIADLQQFDNSPFRNHYYRTNNAGNGWPRQGWGTAAVRRGGTPRLNIIPPISPGFPCPSSLSTSLPLLAKPVNNDRLTGSLCCPNRLHATHPHFNISVSKARKTGFQSLIAKSFNHCPSAVIQ